MRPPLHLPPPPPLFIYLFICCCFSHTTTLPTLPRAQDNHTLKVVSSLLVNKLLHVPDFDDYLHRLVWESLAKGPQVPQTHANALSFTMQLLEHVLIPQGQRAPLFSAADFPVTLELLVYFASRRVPPSKAQLPRLPPVLPLPPHHLANLLNTIKEVTLAREKASGVALGVGYLPPSQLALPLPPSPPLLLGVQGCDWRPTQETVELSERALAAARSVDRYEEDVRMRILYLLEFWVKVVEECKQRPGAFEERANSFISALQAQHLLSNKESLSKFFQILLDLCVESCRVTNQAYPRERAVNAGGALASSEATARLFVAPTPTPLRTLTYTGIDALSKLVKTLVLLNDPATQRRTADSIYQNLFQFLTNFFVRCVLRDADSYGGGCTEQLAVAGVLPPTISQTSNERGPPFDARPYLRFLTNLLRTMHFHNPGASPEEAAQAADLGVKILSIYATVLHELHPVRVPGFAFAWLEFLCHRNFLPELLNSPERKLWPAALRLVLHALRFLYPYLRRGELNEGLRVFLRGVVRLLLLLWHDFPDFLAESAWVLIEAIPLNAVHMRNIVLNAMPRVMGKFSNFTERALHPARPSASRPDVEDLQECHIMPRTLVKIDDALPEPLNREVVNFLFQRPPFALPPLNGTLPQAAAAGTPQANPLSPLSVPPLTQEARNVAIALCSRPVPEGLLSDPREVAATGSKWSLRSINSLVPFLAYATLAKLTNAPGVPNPGVLPSTVIIRQAALHSGAAELLRALLVDLDAEGRFALLSTMVAHLRYPNAFTLFFLRLLMAVWADTQSIPGEAVKEQLTRVLVERLQGQGPHSWGVQVLFAKIYFGNPSGTGGLWQTSFSKASTEASNFYQRFQASCASWLGQAPGDAAGGGGGGGQ